MTDKNRDRTLDALKGAAIFFVMLGHVINLNHMEDPYVYDIIKAVQMPLFMMISGYLCGMGQRTEDIRTYRKVLGRRALAYLLPFFMWILVLYPGEMLSAVRDTLFQLDYGLWFLMTLFLLTAMVHTAQLLSAWVKGNRILREVMFWGIYGGMAAFVLLETMLGWRFLSPSLTRLYIPFYMAGYVTTAYGPTLKKLLIDRWGTQKAGHRLEWVEKWLTVLAAVVFGVLVIGFDLVDMGSLGALLRQITASFAGCYCLFRLCRRWKDDSRSKRFTAWLGGYTLEIYALHFHFATTLNRGVTYELYSWQGLVFVVVSFAFMSLVTAGLIWITKKIWISDVLLYGKVGRMPKRKVKNTFPD